MKMIFFIFSNHYATGIHWNHHRHAIYLDWDFEEQLSRKIRDKISLLGIENSANRLVTTFAGNLCNQFGPNFSSLKDFF